MKKQMYILGMMFLVIGLGEIRGGTLSACSIIRRIESSGIQEGPIDTGQWRGLAQYPQYPRGWEFPRYAIFLDQDGEKIARSGLKITLETMDWWGSNYWPEFYWYLNDPQRAQCPKKIRTRDSGGALYSWTIKRPAWGGYTSYHNNQLAKVTLSSKAGQAYSWVLTYESGSDGPPEYYADQPYERGFYYNSGGSGGVVRTSRSIPILPPGTPPPPYDFEAGVSIEAMGNFEDRVHIGEQGVGLSPEETEFLAVGGMERVCWMRAHFIDDPNDAFYYRAQEIDSMIPLTDDPNTEELAEWAELYFPSFQIDGCPPLTAELLVPGLIGDPNDDPNMVFPVNLEVVASSTDCTRHIVRPRRLFVIVTDPNEDPYYRPFDEIGYQLLVAPGQEGLSIEIRTETTLNRLIKIVECWLDQCSDIDLNGDNTINYVDLYAYCKQE